MLSGVKYQEITEKGIVITNQAGSRETIEVDTIILATEAKPTIDLSLALKGLVPEIFNIGDCQQPRGILEAVSEGSDIGQAI